MIEYEPILIEFDNGDRIELEVRDQVNSTSEQGQVGL